MAELRQPFNQILKLDFLLKFHIHFKWFCRQKTENATDVNPYSFFLLNELVHFRN